MPSIPAGTFPAPGGLENAPDLQMLLNYRARVTECVLAPRTRENYAFGWRRFVEWCGRASRCPLPASADTVIFYFADTLVHGGKVESCRGFLSAIKDAHRTAQIPFDAVEIQRFLTSAQRLRKEKPLQKLALRVEDLRKICALLLPSRRPLDIRNRALLLLSFVTALRRSNVVALDLADLRWESRGLVVVVRRSKVDQTGKGQLIAITPSEHPETDTIGALRQWLEIRASLRGYATQEPALFCTVRYPYCRLSPRHVAKVVKAAVRSIGLDASQYAGHSLRSGMATAAIGNDANELAVMRVTGHTQLSTLDKYIRQRDPFIATATAKLGL